MFTKRLLRSCILAAVGLGLTVEAAGAADCRFGPSEKEMPPGEAKIRAALKKPVDWEFTEKPLVDVLERAEEQAGIQIEIDPRALNDIGVGTDEPVTCSFKGISLESALNLVLRQIDLAWIIEDEVLLVTLPEVAERKLDTVVYDVRVLLVAQGEAFDDDPGAEYDYDGLIEVIKLAVEPGSWDTAGGPGAAAAFRGMLVVRHWRQVHEEIQALLRKLCEKRRQPGPNEGGERGE